MCPGRGEAGPGLVIDAMPGTTGFPKPHDAMLTVIRATLT